MIRQLIPADAGEVLRLRREALESEPLAFSSSPAEDRMRVAGALQAYLAYRTKAIFEAFEPDLIRMAGIVQEETEPAAIWVGAVSVAEHHMVRGLPCRTPSRSPL
jgi:hypothetical protein